jgi:hypothetical protein
VETQLKVPDELRHLGEFRDIYATTLAAVVQSMVRSLVPLVLGGGLIAFAQYGMVNRNWKYYVALGIGILLALQGMRLVVRTVLRWRQKVMIFDKGIAIWRYGRLATYLWDRVEQVEAVIAKAQGAPTSFLSFSFQGRNDAGETHTYNFHPAGDPIPNLQGLWKVIEEEAGFARVASAIATVQAGEEAIFQRTIWGTIVSTQIGVSLFGIRAKPRYEDDRFLDWSRVEQISVVDQPTAPRGEGYTSGGIAHLEILEKYRLQEPWVSELTSELPGYQALMEVAEFARLRYVDTAAELVRERLPGALAMIADGQEFCLGKFGIRGDVLRYEDEHISWADLGYLRFDKDQLVALGDRTFAYDSLTLADRWLMQMVTLSVRYEHEES